uniref:Uncharacterized protein n=1 Tax=Arcella intermedia TaxID=1963864 RepID=A0A6B2LV68_9EUKA
MLEMKGSDVLKLSFSLLWLEVSVLVCMNLSIVLSGSVILNIALILYLEMLCLLVVLLCSLVLLKGCGRNWMLFWT